MPIPPDLDPNGPDLTVVEAAAHLRVHRRTVLNLCHDGTLQAWRNHGTSGNWHIKQQSIIDLKEGIRAT